MNNIRSVEVVRVPVAEYITKAIEHDKELGRASVLRQRAAKLAQSVDDQINAVANTRDMDDWLRAVSSEDNLGLPTEVARGIGNSAFRARVLYLEVERLCAMPAPVLDREANQPISVSLLEGVSPEEAFWKHREAPLIDAQLSAYGSALINPILKNGLLTTLSTIGVSEVNRDGTKELRSTKVNLFSVNEDGEYKPLVEIA